MIETTDLVAKVDECLKAVRKVTGKQISSASLKIQLRDLATGYFATLQGSLSTSNLDASPLDALFQELHAASHKSPSKQRCVDLLRDARRCLVKIEGESLLRVARYVPPGRSAQDVHIVSSLTEVCPSASLAYQQALTDLQQTNRVSWRGPACELREALRETLDTLAPDDAVVATPNFKLEKEARRPTMKQKVRFLLRSRGVPSGAMSTPEEAVAGIEEIVGGLTRSVYNRSSVSTHTATDRSEVGRVHAWVRVVMCELLEIPH